ncbi:ribbon-helix-helix protein, CopG family [candidate division TA06 bacterium]|nr:ribbon-helix-helix protein, CopG family [candidate division TA06 bacterium]
MRQKIGTVLEKSLIKRLHLEAAREGKPISRIIEEALKAYLDRRKIRGNPDIVDATWGTIQISPKELKEVLESDLFET